MMIPNVRIPLEEVNTPRLQEFYAFWVAVKGEHFAPRPGASTAWQRLRVVDASVIPATPHANPNLPTIMIAEKMSDHILATA